MQTLLNMWDSIVGVARDFRFPLDLLDILLVAYLLYKGIMIVRETRAGQLVKGIIIMGACYLLAQLLELNTITWLLNKVFELGIIAIIVVFQPELRRTLEKLGRAKVTTLTPWTHGEDSAKSTVWSQPIEVLCEAVQRLSMSATGALIVIERQTKLGEQIATGVMVDAIPSVELIGNIFFKNSPLHDGAMIMRDGKILAAACFLPKPSHEEDIDKNLGSRHRASLGISEVSDSVTIVVSEETGGISFAVNGRLIRNLSIEKLRQTLHFYLIPEAEETKEKGKKEKKAGFWKGRKK
ncbi:MAG TPA: TIGR00159 family protein [Candidatus Merdivicinus excrementipullorum]|uniref:Diadenylate cyclase n=1 Tax=Candidatus Merdivicinus excrementipullorum TaxID=2840867 RepID=A0A9D1FLF1_9FIRM|nr:TIGR00159 family protein [Candidatus Merdivicinus excrementipullorum]